MIQASKAKSPFHILSKPIGPKCNLNCDYCFYLKKVDLFPGNTSLREFRMSDKILENFVKQYIETSHPASPEVNFSWQGGEPTLLGVDFYKKAIEFQEKYKRPKQPIFNSFQTNGILLNDDWGKFLHKNTFLVGISIDGPKKIHNKYRKNMAGYGSYDQVLKGLEALKRNSVEFNTLTVVQSDNGNFPNEVYHFLKKIGSTYMQFIPIVEQLPEGGVTNRTVKPLQWGTFLCGILDEWLKEDIGKVFVQLFDMMLGLVVGYPSSLCVHGKTCGRNVAIEHNGNLYACDHFVNLTNYLGNITETPLDKLIDGEQQSRFGQDKYDKLPQYCLRCRFLGFVLRRMSG